MRDDEETGLEVFLDGTGLVGFRKQTKPTISNSLRHEISGRNDERFFEFQKPTKNI